MFPLNNPKSVLPTSALSGSGQAQLSAQLSAPSPGVTLPVGSVAKSPALTVERVQFDNASVEIHPMTKVKKDKQGTPSHSADILALSIKGEYEYAKLGLILGVLTIVGGTILGLYGVTGHTSWSARLFGFESNIGDAAPGVVLFVVGIFLILITRAKVKLKDLTG